MDELLSIDHALQLLEGTLYAKDAEEAEVMVHRRARAYFGSRNWRVERLDASPHVMGDGIVVSYEIDYAVREH